MNPSSPTESLVTRPGGTEPPFWQTMIQGWNRFWFTPGDPTLLALIRICCGALATYTIFAYTFELQSFFGKDAWLDWQIRHDSIIESPVVVPALTRVTTQQAQTALTEEQEKYATRYVEKWGDLPPLPFPKNKVEEDYINSYREKWGYDPRLAYSQGSAEWSIWFHVTDPQAMLAVHWLFVFITFLFTIGLGTRVTSVLAWFIALCYIHRSPVTLFGFDTMTLILLMYLMIAPCGAVLSVDRLLARWWRSRRQPAGEKPKSAEEDLVKPTVAANIALRMLQIHVCIIYGAAGLAKLQGNAWWQGTAVWGTLANGEFAPVHSEFYVYLLRELASNPLFLNTFLLCGTYFTLFFEITYPFLIWGKHTRWLLLSMAIVLHGVIGLLMGLKTFALVMLIMNAAFLPNSTVHWFLGLFKGSTQEPARKERPVPALTSKNAIRPEMLSPASEASSHSPHVKQKK